MGKKRQPLCLLISEEVVESISLEFDEDDIVDVTERESRKIRV